MERETSSSDEEEDCQHLVEHNEAKRPSHRSAFHIDDDCRSRIARRFSFSNNKSYYCLLAVFLPLFILITLFSTDIRNFFSSSTVSNAKIDPLRDGMREAELHALYLLRQQQLGLLTLWNRTFDDSVVRPPVLNSTEGNSSLNGFGIRKDESSLLSPLLFGDLKSAVLKQISLNREIRKVLLSPHSTGNSSEWDSGIGDHRLSDYGFNRCRNIDQKISKRRTIEWKPRSNKYLVAICVSGQMSNHLICLEKHMFFAALLDRILVLPSSKIDYQYNRVLDIDHINKCVRRNVVITFEQFAEIKEKDMHIDRFICYFSQPQPCYVDEEHFKKLKSLGISVGKLEPAWIEDIKKPSKRTVQDVEAKFSVDDAVIAIGDVFYADVEKDWVMQPGGPLAHECKTLIEPSRLIMLTAQRFIQTFLGKKFIALHFRRHGFLKFCNAKEQSCFFPIPQAAECICRVAERAYAPVIYLSTDAAESETGLLQKLVIVDGKPIPLVKRPKRNSAEKWDAFLYRHGLEGDNQVEAMLDKTICALSSVFIGSSGSTFTEDILRLRKDWGTASLCDEYLCQGEQPNFIADEE